MTRTILVYGCIAGVIVAACMALSMSSGAEGGIVGMALGYLSMLIALSMVFVGIKKHRDQRLGGVIRFTTALGIGLGISLVASLFYVLGWEAYEYATDYRFMPEYAAHAIAAKRASGASAAEMAKFIADMQEMTKAYADPLRRMLMTLSEIAPVAIIVSLVSAALLRRRDFMPARGG